MLCRTTRLRRSRPDAVMDRPAYGFRSTAEEAVLKEIITFGLTRRPIVMLGLFVFFCAGVIAFTRLNIEAYPNPGTGDPGNHRAGPGLSAEEMERYYTVPMEVGLYPTPGIDNIRSTSFYGLSFVRVTFKYGIDYYFAYTQAALSLQQNVTLPQNQVAQIQASSTVGEIYRYQVVGPPHFGLTNLRTVQTWIATRRLFTVPGVVQINPWGGPTKQYNVDVDLHKLDAYSITLPQVIAALGNANINVGGREITVGQQSVNIRGIGLFDSGGDDDLTKGYRTEDIENVVLAQYNGVPVLVKDVANVSVGYVPRLGIAGKDHDDDVVLAIVVMNRTMHTNDVLPRVKAEVEKINSDGSLPPGVKLVPYYDRSSLVEVTTRTVLHNLVFGCLLVFLIQWIFLGDLRSAIVVAANIPFALFFAVIMLVMTGQDANLLSVGAVDFGIIVNSAVILVENVFRNFQARPEQRHFALLQLAEERWGSDPTKATSGPSPGRTVCVSSWSVRCRSTRRSFFLRPSRSQPSCRCSPCRASRARFSAPWRKPTDTRWSARLFATFTVTPALASLLLPEHVTRGRNIPGAVRCGPLISRRCAGRSITARRWQSVHSYSCS